MVPQFWGILECVVNMVLVNRCLWEIISADVTKITQGTTATKVSVCWVQLRIKSCTPWFVSRFWSIWRSLLSIFLLFSEIDNCENISCKNGGSCLDGIGSFTCVCADGWEGKFCEQGMLLLLILCSFWRRAREVLLLIHLLHDLAVKPVVFMENKVSHFLIPNLLILFLFGL